MKMRVGLSQTINIGNFENVRPSVEVEDDQQFVYRHTNGMQTEDMETPEECYERLSKLCHKLLYQEILKFEQAESNKSSS